MSKPSFLKSFLILLIFPVMFSACKKVNEHVERDILIANEFTFAIPIVSSTSDAVVPILKLNSAIALDDIIKQQAADFGDENLIKAEILSFQIVLTDSVENENNFQNFEILNATIQASELGDLTVAAATTISDSKLGTLTLPLISGNSNILPYLQKGTFSYTINGKARTVTTKALNAKATAVYKLRLAM